MAKKGNIFVGFEQDATSVRGVRVALKTSMRKGNSFRVLAADEEIGDYNNPELYIAALKKIRGSLHIQPTDRISVCLSGKQTYAAQIEVRKLPDDEMASMLKLEMRKGMPFEANSATFDYHILSNPRDRSGDDLVPVMVGVVANAYLNKQVDSFYKAGMRPYHVDILPTSIANVFKTAMGMVVPHDEPQIILHIAANACTLVIDGGTPPFFYRTFAFNANAVIAGSGSAEPNVLAETAMQVNSLASEVTKSVMYYKNTYRVNTSNVLTVLGTHATYPAIVGPLAEKTSLDIRLMQLPPRVDIVAKNEEAESGKFDLSIGLAMQAVEYK